MAVLCALALLACACAAQAAPAAADDAAAFTATMWRELEAHCGAGHCFLAEGSRLSAEANTTDCKGRLLAYQYGLTLIPARKPQLESFDALQLESTCGVTRPSGTSAALQPPLPLEVDVDGLSWSVAPGSSIHAALALARAADPRAKKTIVLKPGLHYLNATVELGPADSGLTITAAPGSKPGDTVVSGGVLLSPTWTKSSRKTTASAIIWETPVPTTAKAGFLGLTTLKPHRRVTRARYPNAAPSQGAELCTGDCWTNGVVRWHHNKTCFGKAQTVYLDLRDCDDDKKQPNGMPCKNDSAMWDTCTSTRVPLQFPYCPAWTEL